MATRIPRRWATPGDCPPVARNATAVVAAATKVATPASERPPRTSSTPATTMPATTRTEETVVAVRGDLSQRRDREASPEPAARCAVRTFEPGERGDEEADARKGDRDRRCARERSQDGAGGEDRDRSGDDGGHSSQPRSAPCAASVLT